MAATPAFDKTKPHGVVAHGDLAGKDPSELPAFLQNGHYFRPDGSYHSADGQPRKVAKPVVEAPVDALTFNLSDEEVAAALLDPRAEELLFLPHDELVKLVQAANGPMLYGEDSHKKMAAWLVKNTANDGL